jgi:hypothetical protein
VQVARSKPPVTHGSILAMASRATQIVSTGTGASLRPHPSGAVGLFESVQRIDLHERARFTFALVVLFPILH